MTLRRSLLASLLALAGLSARAAMPAPGQPAPPFSAADQDGNTVSLADFKGKAAMVLYFYPKDDTPGCTAEACSLRDGHQAILAKGARILGVSADDAASHGAFARKYHLPFPLLADPDRRIIEAYGVRMAVVGLARRVTFVIDRQGVVRHVVEKVDTAAADKQILALLGTLP